MPYLNDKGYTLTELIIAITISLILMAAASATYIAQNRSFVVQENVSEVNTQSKIAHDMLINDIRSAGFGTPDDMNENTINGFTAVITPVDGGNNASDAITIVGGFRMIGTAWPVGTGPATSCPAPSRMSFFTTTQISIIYTGQDGPNVSNKRYLSIDGMNFVQVQNCALDANGICLSSPITITQTSVPLVDTDGDGLCDTGRPVYLVEDATYCIDNTNINKPLLRRIRGGGDPTTCTGIATSDDEVIAENIEDLQFAYTVDAIDNITLAAGSDGLMDDQDGDLDFDTNDYLYDGVNAGVIGTPSTIRAVRVNILAKSDRADMNYQDQGIRPAAIENRNHPQGTDNLRRRWWQTIVTMKNK
ncbi:MAG: PilW family protein [Nitrospirae bacterium]|nr:PilW family protein [Nitrospirota bacterium]